MLWDFIFFVAGVRCAVCQYKFGAKDFSGSGSKFAIICPNCHSPFVQNGEMVHHRFDKKRLVPVSTIKTSSTGSELSIEVRWFALRSKRLLLRDFVIVLTSLFIFWLCYSSIVPFWPEFELIVKLGIISVGVLLSVVLAVGFLRYFFNKTLITISPTETKVRVRPFNFESDILLKNSDVTNFSIERVLAQRAIRNKAGPVYKSYVRVHLKNGKVVRLCRAHDPMEAAQIEKLFENRLMISDDPSLDQIERG